jgi:hypothetical protein
VGWAGNRGPGGQRLGVRQDKAGGHVLYIVLAVLLEYARILYSSARDRSWPAPLSRVHPRTRTPVVATLAVGVAALALTAVSDYAATVTFASLSWSARDGRGGPALAGFARSSTRARWPPSSRRRTLARRRPWDGHRTILVAARSLELGPDE